MGTAGIESRLWGARARDWAEGQEGTVIPLYRAVLQKTQLGAGTALLDVGCGSGMFCEMAARLGARISGLDASEPLVAIARERVPNGDFRVGEMEELPFGDRQFDAVTGFNSFQYAGNPAEALREAGRVARTGAPVVMAVWGKPEDCEAGAYLAALGSLLPPPPPGEGGPFALSQDGALETLASRAGLTPATVEEVDTLWAYRDESTMLRALLSAGPAVLATQRAGDRAVRDAVAHAIAPFRTASGGYEMRNKFRYLVASA